MANDTFDEQCSCPMECDSITYSFNVVSTPFNEKGLCSGQQKNPSPLMSEFYKKPFPKLFVRKLKKLTKNETDSVRDICLTNIQYRAKVSFKLATNNIAVTITSKRLSFFDKLSGFGTSL